MVSEDQAYSIAYAEVGSSVDGWAFSQVGGDGPGGGSPVDPTPIPPPTVWLISWFTADGATLASAEVNAQTGALL